ncbi:dehydratase [Lithospermum erythrorhizon]|uniref:Dehydratase n=1 Tax=Lithospermum erythrorhizon TaxID=34254 RepID=A0AAV3RLN9_LITER
MEKNIKVCVRGGSSFLGCHLIKKLLQKGYTVHATMKNLGDELKVGLLKNLSFADTRLILFQADVYNADSFAPDIHGCEVVIHMATPFQHSAEITLYKSTSEAAIAGVVSISIKDDGSGYKESIDETCWTPLNIAIPHEDDFVMRYTHSKTLAEQALLSQQGSTDMDIISLGCGLVGGNELLHFVPPSEAILLSQIKRDHQTYSLLRFLDAALGKVDFVHVEDVAAAHIFCIENSVPAGRYLCANSYLKSQYSRNCSSLSNS